MRRLDVDWDEAARKVYHEMGLQEDRDAFQRVLGVSDWQNLSEPHRRRSCFWSRA